MITEEELEDLRNEMPPRDVAEFLEDLRLYGAYVREQVERSGVSSKSHEFAVVWEAAADLFEILYKNRTRIAHVWGRMRQDADGAVMRRAIVMELGFGSPERNP